MKYYLVHSDELYHHGILGQKWGVRRYQNSDGTLTEAGRKRKLQARYDLKRNELMKKSLEEFDNSTYSKFEKEFLLTNTDISNKRFKKYLKTNEYSPYEDQHMLKSIELSEDAKKLEKHYVVSQSVTSAFIVYNFTKPIRKLMKKVGLGQKFTLAAIVGSTGAATVSAIDAQFDRNEVIKKYGLNSK